MPRSTRSFVLTADPWNSSPNCTDHAASSESEFGNAQYDGLGLAIRRPAGADKDNTTSDYTGGTAHLSVSPSSSSFNDQYQLRSRSGGLRTADLHTPPLSDTPSENSLSSLAVSLREHEPDFGRSPSPFSLLSRDSSPWRGESRCASPTCFNDNGLGVIPYGAKPAAGGNTNNDETSKMNSSASMSGGYNSGGSTSGGSLNSSGLNSDLIMPSVSVSTVKPFTENGLRLGKLKLLVAGDSGVGKTQLVSALTRFCDHIVHVDDVKSLSVNLDQDLRTQFFEVTASTKPTPFYETMLSGSGSPESAAPLDRNVSLVDTPGYSEFSEPNLCIDLISAYLDQQLRETASTVNVAQQQKKAGNVITSASSLNEFSHVDAVLYVIDGLAKPCDLDFMAKLSEFCPLIPILSKADKQGDALEKTRLKLSLMKQLQDAKVKPFLFGQTLKECMDILENALRSLESCGNGLPSDTASSSSERNHPQSSPPLHLPFCVSTWHDESQDLLASVLMAPDYQPSLYPSDLSVLITYIYSTHGSAWLRHEAAKLFLAWCANLQVCQSLLPVMTRTSPDLYSAKGIYLDSSFLANNGNNNPMTIGSMRSRAQQQTARWIMQLEQVSRTENAVSVRARTGANARRRTRLQPQNNNRNNNASSSSSSSSAAVAVGPASGASGVPDAPPGSTVQQSPPGTARFFSNSIINKDPLGLKYLPGKIMGWVIKASSIAVGIGAIYLWARSSTPVIKDELQTVATSSFDLDALSQKVSQTLSSALGSLGGGWAMII